MLGRFPVSLCQLRGLLRMNSSSRRGVSAMAAGEDAEEGKLGEFFEHMQRLRNYESSGPRRDRLRRRLRPWSPAPPPRRPPHHFPSCSYCRQPGTKGKGSTAAFMSNIMREQCYNSMELHDLKLQLLEDHKRQNAVTACCTELSP
ncbi:hypothetical protein ACP70R_039029 [Stipagrostis hirtigluma subsp. patula]